MYIELTLNYLASRVKKCIEEIRITTQDLKFVFFFSIKIILLLENKKADFN